MIRTRLRRCCKWAACSAFALLAIAAAISPWWYTSARLAGEDTAGRILIQNGHIIFGLWNSPKTDGLYPGAWRMEMDPAGSWSSSGPHGWPPRFFEDEFERGVIMPAWLLVAGLALPAAWLWRRDRRIMQPGHCQKCRYDLTGNTTGVCPECGRPAERPA